MSDVSLVKAGDIIRMPDEINAFNKRNGLPRFRAQEVLAVMKPGEIPADHGYHGPNYGYLNYSEWRFLVNNSVSSKLNRDRFFWPLRHDAPDPPPPEFTPVSYTKTTIVDADPNGDAHD